jgi:5-hydroxyisourate hydrolase-like protein (transthyretin family)
MNHPLISLMGVDSDIITMRQAPIKYTTEHSFNFSTRRYAMNGAIGQIIEPPTIFYDIISRIITLDKNKGSYHSPILLYDIAYTATDILL